VVVTDTGSGAIGSALHTFEVRTRTASSLGADDTELRSQPEE
jgi:hypothetical protein